MTPVFGHGALRLYLLSLLAEAPRHGYELMQALEQRFGGTYSPSAGTIYPRLAKLEEEGLVTKAVEGRKATYAITDAGRAELAGREGELRDLESEITDSVRRMASDVRAGVRSAMQALRADLAAAERDARRTPASAPHPPRPSTPSTPTPSAPDAARPSATSGAAVPPAEPWPHAEAPWRSHDSTGADARHPGERAAARMAVHDIDLALTDFRQRVREAARASGGEHMTTAKAATVRDELEAALLRIKSVLGG
ncbi:PadR family transcriptional regulator [Agrococcus carbonis]|uniref:DNA-binding transcriptional regulator, PadR family n=1 Tax=Agrococcus carbonis TaxID=684552 RepID=A0A1H1QWE5_9MICO|nr:PadR family transcriptional regulator [Agrococcus carbonis]SDS27788.1 DNA-binding transcriptional regulator, PadR family [Agrococcus carbonis]